MKRDMDLIREILLLAESDGDHKTTNDYTEEQSLSRPALDRCGID